MKVIIGNQYYPAIEGSSVKITRSATDPIPTCALDLRDVSSSLNPLRMQEIIVIDDQVIPNPTINNLFSPSLNPFSPNWFTFTSGAVTVTQITGGGAQVAFSSASSGAVGHLNIGSAPQIPVTAGQTYTLSAYFQGTATPANIAAFLRIQWEDAGGSVISTAQNTFAPLSTSNVRYSIVGQAPAGSVYGFITIGCHATANGVTGTIAMTNPQLEPNWFPAQSYPTPWCGPSQTNCQQLPLGYWIRQYRKFAGFVTHVVAHDYHGNVRTLGVNTVGYAWLMGTIHANDSFSSKTDAQIISSLLNKYLTHQPAFSSAIPMLTTTNVVTGITVSSLQSNWDDLRTLFDGLSGISGWPWTVDYYWNFDYAPAGYFAMPISLICDNSSTPDFATTYPGYNFSAEHDYTQPGSTILVIGSGSNVSEVIDPGQVAQLGQISGYILPTGTSWMRKINDSTLNSTTDTTNRGLAEMLQYDFERGLYHVTTNVELLPGQSIQITSATDGLNQSTQLIQQVSASWIGTNELLVDEWEYVSDLGATNRAVTSMISRIHRQTQKNTSAPAISTTTLETFESIGITDTVATSNTLATGYQPTVLGDGPIGYYRLSTLQGTVADDLSGNGNTGTIVNSPTLGVGTLLTDSAYIDTIDSAITFASASSQDITLPTSMIPTGASPWSLECWFKLASVPASGSHQTLMGWGASTGNQKFGVLNLSSNGTTWHLVCSTNNGDISSGNLSTGTIYHAVGTYDGTSTRLYLNGSLVAGPTAFTLSLTATLAQIASYTAYSSSYLNGTLDEVAFYTFALSAGQISAHYAAGI